MGSGEVITVTVSHRLLIQCRISCGQSDLTRGVKTRFRFALSLFTLRFSLFYCIYCVVCSVSVWALLPDLNKLDWIGLEYGESGRTS